MDQPHPQPGAETPCAHGLISESIHGVLNEVASVFGKSDNSSRQTGLMWDTADTVAGFVKSVPLFMGPGRGTAAAAVLNGLDEVHSGDTGAHMAMDFAAGASKGVLNKALMDHYGAAEMSLLGKGAIIGGGSSLIDATLSRRTWTNSAGQFDFGAGLERTAAQTAMGTGVGVIAFPLGNALGSRVAPTAESLLGKTFNRGIVDSMTIGGSFGFTSGVVGESARQMLSGQFDPLAIAKRGALDGFSTMAAGGVGHRLSASYVPLDFRVAQSSTAGGGTEQQTGNLDAVPRTSAAPVEAERTTLATTAREARTRSADVDGRPADEGNRQRVEREWVPLTPDQLTTATSLAAGDFAKLRVEPGKSAADVMRAAFNDGVVADPQRLGIANGLIREHFASLRTQDKGIIPDQGANWVHTVNEEARVVEYARLLRQAAVDKAGLEPGTPQAAVVAEAAMPAQDTTLALIASATSDSTKSQAADFDNLNPDGTVEKLKLPANFHTHPQDAVLALDVMRNQLHLSDTEFNLTKQAILAHQVSPAETIMGMLYQFKISGTVAAMVKAQASGDTSALPKWIQEKMAADPEFPQKMEQALKDNLRPVRNPGMEADTGNITEKPSYMPKVIKFIADTRYLLAPPSEVPAGAEIPPVKMTDDGKGWELALNADQRLLMRMAGDEHWYVPHLPTQQEAASMTPGQLQYFDRLWRISNALAAGDNSQYGGMEAPYKYIGAMRGPGTTFHDKTAWESLGSLIDSRDDARWVMDPYGRQLLKDTTAKTESIYNRDSGSFRRRADKALISEFGETIDGQDPAAVTAAMDRVDIWSHAPNSVAERLRAPRYEQARTEILSGQLSPADRARAVAQYAQQAGVSESDVNDFVLASHAEDWLKNLPYWEKPITEGDYQQGNTPDYLIAIKVKQIVARAARQEAAVDPDNASDNFDSVRWNQRQGQPQ
jgi:hypothetical protein